MILNQKSIHNIMEDFIKTINIYDYERFRARVIQECNVSTATWSNWRNGKNEPEAKYKAIIDQVAREMFGRTIFVEGGAK